MRSFVIKPLCLLLSLGSALAQATQQTPPFDPVQFLPPAASWHGKSEQLIQATNQTPIEQSNFTNTPTYQQTVDWFEAVAVKSPLIRLSYFGTTAQGRQLPLIHVSSDFSNKQRNKLLVQAGIHSGEIDGKDAGMMLLRDIASGKKSQLVNGVDLLFVPIFNADGHENSSIYNRVNQRGPTNMGWRTNAQNINLNRDYAKAQSLELQAMLALIDTYNPSLYLDLHVTDGTDYQYDITYGTPEAHSYSPKIANWFNRYYRPALDQQLADSGHIPGPLVFAKDNSDFKQGIYGWTSTPRYSDGYGAARHLPTVLVENHSLKPYKQRVLGTYILIESSLKILSQQGASLEKAINEDRQARPKTLALDWTSNEVTHISFKGIQYESFLDEISGAQQVRWLGKNKLYPRLPFFPQNIAKHTVTIPAAYWLMPEDSRAIATLKRHGIKLERITAEKTLQLEQLTAHDEQFGKTPYEGVMRATASFTPESKTMTLPRGAVKVVTNQPLGKLAVSLLEPMAPDSLFQWGFFNTMFQRTEYIEGYAIVPLAQEMLRTNPVLAKQFKQKLASEPKFAQSPRARLAWFYQQSPFFDRRYRQYPVLRQLD